MRFIETIHGGVVDLCAVAAIYCEEQPERGWDTAWGRVVVETCGGGVYHVFEIEDADGESFIENERMDEVRAEMNRIVEIWKEVVA